jgi:cellulose synthase/poly-beta-1,6-N-acetylglucosamine synthase-like glycosyltransferase
MLTGSGMAFPWAVLRAVPLASGKLAEDVWLTIELAGRNQYVLLDAGARVLGKMPASVPGARAQHTRWEHGHLESILQGVPKLVHAAWEQKRLEPLWLMLDLCVPPLSLLFSAWVIVFLPSLAASILGLAHLPLAGMLMGGLLFVSAIVAAWSRYGRDQLPLAALVSVPLYVLAKLPLYGAFFVRRQRRWNRSERQ